MEVQEVKEQLKSIFRQVINNDKWITIHPNGEDGKGRHLLLKDGETPKEAIDRTYGKDEKSDTKDKFGDKGFKKDEKSDRWHLEKDGEMHTIVKTAPGKYRYNVTEWDKEKGSGKELFDKLGLSEEELKKEISEFEKKNDKKDRFRYDGKTKIKQITKKEWADTPDDYKMVKDGQKYIMYIDDESHSTVLGKAEIVDESDKQSDSKGDLDIKKTTVKMKSGKEKEIEYVDNVPEGYKKLEGAMTAPLGYTWYHNGKSIIDKERKTILVKDKVNNDKEQDMALLEELKKLITKVENTKGEEEMEIENEKVDKRKLIDEVGGILKGKVDDEVIRTIIGKMEKMSYDDSEASADNKKVKNEADEEDEKEDKKVDNEDEEDEEKVEKLKKEEKKDVDNKCKNSKEENYFDKLNKIYNSAKKIEEPSADYESKQARLDAGKEYFG